jgi:hypothetical protein
MEAVKAVELPKGEGGYGALLGKGVGELVLDFDESAEAPEKRGCKPIEETEETGGRKLLEYATRRKGDYYASRLPQKTE